MTIGLCLLKVKLNRLILQDLIGLSVGRQLLGELTMVMSPNGQLIGHAIIPMMNADGVLIVMICIYLLFSPCGNNNNGDMETKTNLNLKRLTSSSKILYY